MSLTLGAPDQLRDRQLAMTQNEVKAQLTRAQTELTTGRRLDLIEASGGDVSRIAALERSIAQVDSRLPLIGLAKSRAELTQDALGAVQALTEGVGLNLVNDVTVGDVGTAILTAREARERLDSMLGALNTSYAGRPLFGGSDVDGLPFPDADTLIGFVQAALDAYPDVNDALAAVDEFFDPPGGDPANYTLYPDTAVAFAPDVYQGSTTADAPPVEVAPGQRVAYAVRGDDPTLKAILKNMAIAAAVDGSINFQADTVERSTIFSTVGQRLIDLDTDMSTLRAELGMAEDRIEESETRQQSEKTTLTVAFNEMTERDPFEAATAVAELETRLQAIYEITARASRLSFVNFL